MNRPIYKDLYDETDGIFKYLPTDIWGSDEYVNTTLLDIQLKARIYYMSPSIIANMYITDNVLDSESLARIAFQTHSRSWQKLWDAITELEYKVDETDFKNTTLTISDLVENFNTFNEGVQTNEKQDGSVTGTDTNIKSGSLTDSRTNTNTKNLKDSKTVNLTDTHKINEKETDKKGTTVTTSNSDKKTLNLTDTEDLDKTTKDLDRGLGTSSMYLSTQENEDSYNKNRKTGYEQDTGKTTEKETGSDTLTKTGTNTDISKGTDITALTGTDTTKETNEQKYNSIKDAKTTKDLTTNKVDSHTDRSNQNEGMTMTEHTEVFESRGSSPLRTPQAMIEEEINLRKTNYFDLVMRDIMLLICNKYISKEVE